MDWLSADAFSERYAPSDGKPLGNAKYVLHPHGSPYYYDTARTGGVGGKANTRRGGQTARFKGSQLHAGQRAVQPGDEIFVPYGGGYRFGSDTDDERQGWTFARRRPIPHFNRTRATPAPRRPRAGGNLFRRQCFSTLLRGVCANLRSAADPVRANRSPPYQLRLWVRVFRLPGRHRLFTALDTHTHTWCASYIPLSTRDQLGLERARVRQIADRSAVEHATGHRTTVGDPRNSNAFEL